MYSSLSLKGEPRLPSPAGDHYLRPLSGKAQGDDMDDESKYHKQREGAKEHPNRKKKEKPYHDTERPYEEVAGQIEDAIAQFKRQQRKS
jgi:hypothetical protein